MLAGNTVGVQVPLSAPYTSFWRVDNPPPVANRPHKKLLGGFAGELEPTFLFEFVVAALFDRAFDELLLLEGGDFFG